MKLKEYAKCINKLLKKYGGDLEVIYSIDDEGNDFNYIIMNPEVGVLSRNGFTPIKMMESEETPNIICIN